MGVNLALLDGRLALPPEFEWQTDGSRRARLLVCVRSERRGRFDVVPVVVPADVGGASLASAAAGDRIYVAGPLMRRYSPNEWEPAGRIEVVADSVRLRVHEIDGFDVEDGGRRR